MLISELDTPSLLIDREKLLKNLHTIQEIVAPYGKHLRPHVKTHKCTALAKLQIQQGGAIGISAAKLGEAEGLVKAGINNILITSPLVTKTKIQRLIHLLQQEPEILLVIDCEANAHELSQAMTANQLVLDVLVDIDPGVHRTGARYEHALALGELVSSLPGLNLHGIQCYAGNLQHVHDYIERHELSLSAMQRAALVVEQFRQQGLCCDIFTGSGTGTYDIDMEIPELTEVQPGSYTVMDMEYRLIGSRENEARFEQFLPAMTMLTSVISANHATHVTVDAGTKSLYFDMHTKPKVISHPQCQYDWGGFGDEHGKLTGAPLPQLGETLELIVPHCDPTINLFDRFYITEGDQVVDEWPIDLRGQSQ